MIVNNLCSDVFGIILDYHGKGNLLKLVCKKFNKMISDSYYTVYYKVKKMKGEDVGYTINKNIVVGITINNLCGKANYRLYDKLCWAWNNFDLNNKNNSITIRLVGKLPFDIIHIWWVLDELIRDKKKFGKCRLMMAIPKKIAMEAILEYGVDLCKNNIMVKVI